MNAIVFWILINISYGSHNYGTITVIERFNTAPDCVLTRDVIATKMPNSTILVCAPASGVFGYTPKPKE